MHSGRMKKMVAIFVLVFVVISACMLYLLRSGVGLRSAPLIKPTVIGSDTRIIANHTVKRLFPEMQQAHYIVWGVQPETDDSQLLMTYFLDEYQKTFHNPARILKNAESLSSQEISQCEKPCWLLISKNLANELTPNKFIEEKIAPLKKEFINITFLNFSRDEKVSEKCDQEQRLTLDCVVPVSVREVTKRLKDPSQRYFFLRKYNDRDFFLFIQNP